MIYFLFLSYRFQRLFSQNDNQHISQSHCIILLLLRQPDTIYYMYCRSLHFLPQLVVLVFLSDFG